ncbi:MAG: acyl-CoA thioesterase [Planctomycetes bacterium]|nr:acyl-CoA thioesterase [Planctomycetota bacterium]
MEAPRVPDSESMHFRVRLVTRWSDEDVQGVVNNAVYLTLFEEARHRFFGGLGLIERGEFPFLLAQCNVRFVAPGRGGVEVDVELSTTHVGTTSLVQAYRVLEADSGRVWCEAEALLVGWDGTRRAKAPWTDAFRAALRR